MAPSTFAYKREDAEKRFREGNLHTVWDPSSLGIKESAHVNAWFELLNGFQGRRDVHWLLNGNDKPKDKEQSHALAQEIILDKGLKAKEKHDLLLVFGKIIETGNRMGLWELCPPPVSSYVPREQGPYSPPAFSHNLAHARGLKRFLLSSLEKEYVLDEKAQVGRILCSSVLFGGLLSKASLEALIRQVGEPLNIVRDIAYLDLRLSWRGHEDMEERRWFPDALTELLLLVYSGTPESSDKLGTPWECIKQFLTEAGCPKKQRPKTLYDLLNAVTLELRLVLPPMLLTYATRGCISHSLKPHAWLRIQGLPLQENTAADAPVAQAFVKLDDAKETGTLEEAAWLGALRACLRSSSKPSARSALKAFRATAEYEDGGPLAAYLTGWADELLSHGSMIGRPLQLSTVYQYVTSLGNRLAGLPQSGEFPRLGAEAIEELYVQVLESAETRGLRQKLARILRELHHYLVSQHEIVEIDPDILGARDGLAPVDANLITHDEFERILTLLDRSGLELIHPDLATIAQLVCILAFRTGLRRSEVQKVRLIDLQGTVDPELLIRPHATRRLKTHNSTRRVPLRELLGPEELVLLFAWNDKRLAQERARPWSEYLFSIPAKGYAFVAEEVLFDIIHRAMREATGDPSVRFHHFRHSCGSWLTLAFVAADQGYPTGYFTHLPLTRRWLDGAKVFREAWYRHGQPTRKHLYSVCALLGHGSPDITLEHYIHWCDVLLAHALKRHTAKDTASLLIPAARLYGWLPKSSTYRLAKTGSHALLKRLREDRRHRCLVIDIPPLGRAVAMNENSNDIQESDVTAMIKRIWNALYMHSLHGTPLEELGERYGFRKDDIDTYIQRASAIARLPSGRGKKGFRHRMVKVLVDKSGSIIKKRLLCPIEPKRGWEAEDARIMLRKLGELAASDPDTLLWGLHHYLNSAWASFNDVVAKNNQDANSYFRFLKRLGIADDHLKLYLYVKPTATSGATQKVFDRWRNTLPASIRSIPLTRVRVRKRDLRSPGWLGIAVIPRTHRHPSEDASPGFRYAILMYAIYHGFVI